MIKRKIRETDFPNSFSFEPPTVDSKLGKAIDALSEVIEKHGIFAIIILQSILIIVAIIFLFQGSRLSGDKAKQMGDGIPCKVKIEKALNEATTFSVNGS